MKGRTDTIARTRKLRIYVDTSVIGGCLDTEFAAASNALLDMARQGRIVLLLSDLLATELSRAPRNVQNVLSSLSPEHTETVPETFETQRLRDLYISAGVATRAQANDALHVALATIARADMIVSWNFKHIVHFDKIRGFNSVNIREGLPPIAIYSPLEVI